MITARRGTLLGRLRKSQIVPLTPYLFACPLVAIGISFTLIGFSTGWHDFAAFGVISLAIGMLIIIRAHGAVKTGRR